LDLGGTGLIVTYSDIDRLQTDFNYGAGFVCPRILTADEWFDEGYRE
jgi:hypothetical protein